jgi:hypothetical protein
VGLDSVDSKQDAKQGFCELNNKPFFAIEDEKFLYQLKSYHLFNNGHSP